MADTSFDYLRWDANSMKEYIVNKLTEDGTYSDQIFEGSDLSVIIDVFAAMYDVLTYQLNTGASEAIFTDSQLYENMNRIVKMLGYNPQGFITPTVTNTMGIRTGETISSPGILTIPKYTTYTTDLIDSDGNSIKYAFIDNYSFVAGSNSISTNFQPSLYNGTWKLYETTFTSTGIPYETFTLDALDLDGDDKVFLSHKHIEIYTKDSAGNYLHYSPVTDLYNSAGTDYNFEVRLNEDKKYTLKFGDGINGRKLPSNVTLFVIYLQSNGGDGEIGSGKINTDGELSVSIDGLDETFIKNNILKVDENPGFITFGTDPDEQLSKITLYNDDASTSAKDMETVDEIRENAPNWFRMGSRLITNQDFVQYTLMNYSSEVYDIKVMNNWEYMVQFQEWLRVYNKLDIDIRHYSYSYSDSCDFNNIYLWLKSYNDSYVTKSTKRIIERDINRLKPLTSEIVPLDPFMVTLTPYLAGSYDKTTWDTNFENKIVVTRDRNTLITVERIKQRVVKTIQTFFSLESCSLGMTININNLYNSLLAIDGVKTVQTSYLPNGSPTSETQYFDGLSFGMWTQHLILGADFTRISGNITIKDFQFPFLLDSSTFANKVEVTSDNFNVNEVEY